MGPCGCHVVCVVFGGDFESIQGFLEGACRNSEVAFLFVIQIYPMDFFLWLILIFICNWVRNKILFHRERLGEVLDGGVRIVYYAYYLAQRVFCGSHNEISQKDFGTCLSI